MKKKMSGKALRRIVVPIVLVVFLLCQAATAGMLAFRVALDDYLGMGKMSIIKPEGSENWDTDYYGNPYKDNTEAKEASYKTAQKVQEEGSVLLKNNGVLPLSKGSTVTPFGYRYLEPIYGQVSTGGSAKWTVSPVTPEDGLKKAYTVNSAAADKMKQAGKPEGLLEAPGTLSAGTLNDMMGGDSKIYEYDPSIYSGISGTQDSTAIIFIARAGQEGSDKKYNGYADGTSHYLALSKNERDTIAYAKSVCKNTVVILASSAPMEVGVLMSGDLEVDAIMQVGHVGEKGFAVLGDLLCGDVVPSGRTVDTWPADFTKDPTYQNFGEMTYTNAFFKDHASGSPSSAVGGGQFKRYFYEYQEDIYMGYRYYETAEVMDDTFVYGELDDQGASVVSGAVNYPFGYGLSYTTFQQEILSFNETEEEIEVTVLVKNIGDMAGKEVVQIYYSAPYTEFDMANRIEKSVVNLAAFEKTGIIEPNGEETVVISFAKEDMASYAYTHDNGDGTKGAYMLEEGDYAISLRKDSHHVIDSKTVKVSETVWYSGENLRKSDKDAQTALDAEGNLLDHSASGNAYVAPSNHFDECTEYMYNESYILTRADWKNSFPATPANREKTLMQSTIDLFGIEETFDPQTDPKLGNGKDSLVYSDKEWKAVEKGLRVTDMRGVDYYDEKWEDFLDQLDFSNSAVLKQVVEMMDGANYFITKVSAIKLPDSKQSDGANGIKAVKTDSGMELSATYGYAPLMASTWNKELMYEVGNMLGKEAQMNGVSGWYSPAINLHRSPFSGRVFEYYSEDPVLTGKLASAVVSGAGDAGLFCYIKHFAVNDQETNREFLVHTWATEQAMRELYFKAFEIPFKEARMTVKYISDNQGTVSTKTMRAATAVMASQNDIGPTIAHANYGLLTELLREEWGFNGIVLTDMYIWSGTKTMYDLTFRAGSDNFLSFSNLTGIVDTKSTTFRNVARRAVHDVCYTVANSALMDHNAPGSTIVYAMSPWKIGLIIAQVVVDLSTVGAVVWLVLRAKDEKANPDNYKS